MKCLFRDIVSLPEMQCKKLKTSLYIYVMADNGLHNGKNQIFIVVTKNTIEIAILTVQLWVPMTEGEM